MKRLIAVSRAALMIMVLASLAACKGGTFFDPGHEAVFTNRGGGGKPALLTSNASYQDAVSKLDEITSYCENHPGSASSAVKNAVTAFRMSSFAYTDESNWNSTIARQGIDVINEFIGLLQ